MTDRCRNYKLTTEVSSVELQVRVSFSVLQISVMLSYKHLFNKV